MIALYEEMPKVLQQQVVVRQQLAFAYNRRASTDGTVVDRERACAILDKLIAQHGPSSETWGLVGRVHKDAWQVARRDDPQTAPAHLADAIAAYRRGFEADWSDPYPGINLVTLLEIEGSRAALREKGRLLPVVRYGAAQRLNRKSPDYWDHATMLELAALDSRPAGARRYLSSTLALVRESWEPRSTAANLDLIQQARQTRGAEVGWLIPIRQALQERERL
jgi:MAP3K TRAFs-binding domain